MALSIMDNKANKTRKGSETNFKERSSEMTWFSAEKAMEWGLVDKIE